MRSVESCDSRCSATGITTISAVVESACNSSHNMQGVDKQHQSTALQSLCTHDISTAKAAAKSRYRCQPIIPHRRPSPPSSPALGCWAGDAPPYPFLPQSPLLSTYPWLKGLAPLLL